MSGILGKLADLIRTRAGGWEDAFGRRGAKRRLRLRETLPLGERRFLAIVEFHGKELLLGGTANSITLLETVSLAGSEPLSSALPARVLPNPDERQKCQESF